MRSIKAEYFTRAHHSGESAVIGFKPLWVRSFLDDHGDLKSIIEALAAMATDVAQVRVDARELESDDSNKWETICWGCNLQLTLARFEPIFKCGYCGAVTVHSSSSSVHHPKLERLRWIDRCSPMLDHLLVTLVFIIIICIIGGGVWTVFPVLFPSYGSRGFLFHSAITAVLAFNTIFNFVMAAFVPAGPLPQIECGSVDVVTRGSLENFKFCSHCQKPKPPAAHHCRTCKACVMDMDHHCPFIGNCVGENNHGYFILFLLFTWLSCLYVLAMSAYTFKYTSLMDDDDDPEGAALDLSQFSAASVLAPVLIDDTLETGVATIRQIGLLYLLIVTVALLIGISILLHQQLTLVYQGQTFVDSLSPGEPPRKQPGCGNLQRVLANRNGRAYSRSFRWSKFKDTTCKLTAITVLAATLMWWNEHKSFNDFL